VARDVGFDLGVHGAKKIYTTMGRVTGVAIRIYQKKSNLRHDEKVSKCLKLGENQK